MIAGQTGSLGTKIGIMDGKGGVPKHVHVDIGLGINRVQNLTKLTTGEIEADEKLVYEFCNWNLFRFEPVITTYFMEPGYKEGPGKGIKEHPALDIVPEDRHETDEHFDIYWPLDCDFEVISVGEYSDGTTYMIVWFEWEEDMKLDFNEDYPGEKEEYEEDRVLDQEDIIDLDENWEWELLVESLEILHQEYKGKKLLNNKRWIEQAKNKEISLDKLTLVNTILISRIYKILKGDK
jgi:hypothetical protein